MIFVINLQKIYYFIINDGYKEKHQRSYLFNHEFVYADISYYNHKTFKIWIVLDYANEIGEESEVIIININNYIVKIMGKENKQKNAFQTKNIMGNIQKKYILMKLKIENNNVYKKI